MRILGSPATADSPATLVTPNVAGDTEILVTLVANDGVNNSLPVTAGMTVSRMNLVPVARARAPSFTQVNRVVTLESGGSFDPEGGALTYLWEQVSPPTPVLLSAQAAENANPTFTMPNVAAVTFRLTVTDVEGAVSPNLAEVVIRRGGNTTRDVAGILLVSEPPVVLVGQTVTLTVYAYDPDGEPLTLTWEPNTFGFGYGSAGLPYPPVTPLPSTEYGVYRATAVPTLPQFQFGYFVRVCDGRETGGATACARVQDGGTTHVRASASVATTQPVLSPTKQTVREGERVTLVATLNGQTNPQYSVTPRGGANVPYPFEVSSDRLTVTFTAPATDVPTWVAVDLDTGAAAGASPGAAAGVSVLPINPPVVTASAVLGDDGVVTLTADGTYDVDGDTLTYSWEVSGRGLDVDLDAQSAATPARRTFTPPVLQAETEFIFTLTVGDGFREVMETVRLDVTAGFVG